MDYLETIKKRKRSPVNSIKEMGDSDVATSNKVPASRIESAEKVRSSRLNTIEPIRSNGFKASEKVAPTDIKSIKKIRPSSFEGSDSIEPSKVPETNKTKSGFEGVDFTVKSKLRSAMKREPGAVVQMKKKDSDFALEALKPQPKPKITAYAERVKKRAK